MRASRFRTASRRYRAQTTNCCGAAFGETCRRAPSHGDEIDRFHDGAHEAGGIPAWRVRLSLAANVGAADHHGVGAGRRPRDLRALSRGEEDRSQAIAPPGNQFSF